VLGSYAESLKNFKKAMVLIESHNTSIMDPYVKARWSQFQQEMAKEFDMLNQIHQSLNSLKGSSSTSTNDVVSLFDF